MNQPDPPPRSRTARWLDTGRSTMVVAAVWSVFDALLHVAIDMVEPPRIGGNIAVVAAAIVVHLIPRRRVSALVVGLAGGVVVGLNAAFMPNEVEVLIPTLVFIGVALGLSAWAMWRFVRQPVEGQESGRARTLVQRG